MLSDSRHQYWPIVSFLAIVLLASLTGCFSGTAPIQTYAVSGRVTHADNPQLGIPDVQLAFSGGFGVTATGPDGTWGKTGLSGGVTVTPQLSGWAFSPPSSVVKAPTTDVDFAGRPVTPIEVRDVPYIPKAIAGGDVSPLQGLSYSDQWGAWEVIPQISTNYNNWVRNLNERVLPGLAQLTPDAQYFSLDGEQYHINFRDIDDPLYNIKISLTYDNGDIRAVYMKKADGSRYTYIVKRKDFLMEPEIRQLVFEDLGYIVHAQALYYRRLAGDMNDIVEIWEDSGTKRIKCFRVYDLSKPERFRMASAFAADLLSANNKTTGRMFHGSRDSGLDVHEIPESPAIFNDDELLVTEGLESPPEGYPSFDEVLAVYYSGITLETVAGANIDPDTLESNL